ncbi:MAG: dihydrodipicolinate synthase family protein [Anaerolineae bacterium]|nr:dihydrodipicolinate synthase family protein [Anaerolineae bacterium]
MTQMDPVGMIKPRRKISGISAILLPFLEDGSVDWASFNAHVERTSNAGLAPAVNMDTGYANLLDEATRLEVLKQTRASLGTRKEIRFVAGAFVDAAEGSAWNRDETLRQVELIQQQGGIPVIFQNFGLTGQPRDQLLESYAEIGRHAPQFIAFELGKMFASFGMIYDLDTYAGLLDIPQCIGAKHSSLSRQQEWQRILLRDSKRPDFKVYTGNDLAIDMVMYGSDYLLGLSTFAPDLFAKRDAMWLAGDPAFYGLNDLLQYLGFFAFRAPVPAYKHSAAQFLKLRGWTKTNKTHPRSPERPESDIPILGEIAIRLGEYQ